MGPPPAAPFTVPLPTWKDTKLRIKVNSTPAHFSLINVIFILSIYVSVIYTESNAGVPAQPGEQDQGVGGEGGGAGAQPEGQRGPAQGAARHADSLGARGGSRWN